MTNLMRRALGKMIWFGRRAVPRLEDRYAALPASVALAPGTDLAEHRSRLLSYYAGLRAVSTALRADFQLTVEVDARSSTAEQLLEALASVSWQLGGGWKVRIVGVPDEQTAVVAQRFQRRHATQVVICPDPGDGRQKLAVEQSAGFTILLDGRDRLLPQALVELRRWLTWDAQSHDQLPVLMYADDRLIDEQGAPVATPRFRPGWSPLLLLQRNYLGRTLVVRNDRVAHLPDAARTWEIALAVGRDPGDRVVHVPQLLFQQRTVPAETNGHIPPPRVAVQDFCFARDWPLPLSGTTGQIKFPISEPVPTVSVIIPTRDRPELLAACLASVRTHTNYPHLEILVVDNDSADPAARAIIDRAAAHENVQILRHPGEFNFASMNNRAAATARGEFLVLLNNDTEVMSANWLNQLISLARLPGVGAVGPQLRYPDGSVQHAGLIGLGAHGTGHAFVAADPDTVEESGLLDHTREVLAVTGACLAINKQTYWSVGGLNEDLIPNDSGDVDLCLRLRAAGLVNVYCPAAVLLHRESVSRGPSFLGFERNYLKQIWSNDILNDPYRNPNLEPSSRMRPDPNFPVPDIPEPLAGQWLAAGAVPADPPTVRTR
jgi:GT2 family glycosyltransferase